MNILSRSTRSISITFVLFNLVLSGFTFANEVAPKTFKILSLNIKQFPYGMVSSNNYPRADKLAAIIREKSEEFDVVAVQELWSNRTRAYFYHQIADLYPHKFEDNEWGFLIAGFHSGLAIYSKYPVSRRVLHTYENYRGHENLAKKGVLGVELEVDGKPVYVFTTHMQAGTGGCFFEWWDRNKPSTSEISSLQLKEARQVIDEFRLKGRAPTFLVGDFNITAGNDEYRNGLAALVNVRDTFDPEKSKLIGTSWNDYPAENRIDYIMTLDYPTEGYSIVSDYFGADVTDHLGVIGNFDLSRFEF